MPFWWFSAYCGPMRSKESYIKSTSDFVVIVNLSVKNASSNLNKWSFQLKLCSRNIHIYTAGSVKYASAVDSSFTLVVCLNKLYLRPKTMTRNNNKHTNFCNLQRDPSMTWEKGKYKVIQEQIVNRCTKEETENQKKEREECFMMNETDVWDDGERKREP